LTWRSPCSVTLASCFIDAGSSNGLLYIFIYAVAIGAINQFISLNQIQTFLNNLILTSVQMVSNMSRGTKPFSLTAQEKWLWSKSDQMIALVASLTADPAALEGRKFVGRGLGLSFDAQFSKHGDREVSRTRDAKLK
jgi:hypothetical protein